VTSPIEALNDAQLIDRVRANDAAAFAELRRRHQSDAIRAARVVAHDPGEADRIATEAFERLHADLAAGGGPHAAVSPYLRTMIRRGALDAHRTPGDEHEAVDPSAVEDLPYATDPLTTVEDRNVIREAYEALPERWQRALWFTEIEGRTPAALVPDLGSAAKAVAAMAYRAREGLRQAYLAVHVSVAVSPECQPVVSNLPAYVREALSPHDDVTVAIHLDTCIDCRNRRYELLLLVSNLRSVLAPALLGYRAGTPAATRPVAGFGGAAAAGVAIAAGRARTSAMAAMAAVSQWPRRAIKLAATAAVAVLAAAALAWAASSAFAPTISADAASNGNDSLDVTFEQSNDPAVTTSPLDPLDGVPDEEDEEEPAQTDEAESTGDTPAAGGDAGTGGSEPRATADAGASGNSSAGDGPAAAADSNNNTSGSGPVDSSTTEPAGGGAAAGAAGESPGNGAGNGGNQSPPNGGSDSGSSDQPAPPAGNDGDPDDEEDEPAKPDEDPDKGGKDKPGLVERVLCLILC
jgi:DNA-directed RNA polymerase specialized sigma24 family protein